MKGRKGRAHGAHAELAGGRLEGSRRNDAHAQNHLVQHFCECSATGSELRIWEALRKPAPWEGSEGTKARKWWCRDLVFLAHTIDARKERALALCGHFPRTEHAHAASSLSRQMDDAVRHGHKC